MENKVETTVKKRHMGVAVLLVIYDAVLANLAYLIALWLRFDCRATLIPEYYIDGWLSAIPVFTVITLIAMSALKLYNSIWRFASFNEMFKTLAASIIGGLVQLVWSFGYSSIIPDTFRMPISYFIFGCIFEFIFLAGIRFSYRIGRMIVINMEQKSISGHKKNVMVIGAGDAGRSIVRELLTSRFLDDKVCCIIDDNADKCNRYMEGIPIVGNRTCIMDACEKYNINQIIFAIPTATATEKRDILNICKETGCELKILPGIYQMIKGEVSISNLRNVSVEDLLGRDQIKVNLDEIVENVSDKVILVTGGGGSIGSELCRQIAMHKPKQLVIFDIYENNAYDIEQELKREHPELNLVTLIGSVRDTRRIEMVFERYRPQIVYHAAAHKHVPLMETSPNEAVKNNVFGTYKTAMAASKFGTEKFVLISTDKAVNPTNIMGATKRMCEMIVQTLNKISDTDFVAVRFGNVLGSNGSVIPLFKKQIEEGGPVTVTHPDIIRYFMTIPEAVSLVLQAGAYAKGGEIFILDMGEPVKIDDLARNLIKLSGYTPDVDMRIEYTGLRPGEKLFEEKLMAEEGLQKTPNQLIHIAHPIDIDTEKFLNELVKLKDECYNNSDNIKQRVSEITGTYVVK